MRDGKVGKRCCGTSQTFVHVCSHIYATFGSKIAGLVSNHRSWSLTIHDVQTSTNPSLHACLAIAVVPPALHEPPKLTTACLFFTWRSSLPLFYRLSLLLGCIVSYVRHHYVQMIYVWRFSRDKAGTALGTSCSLHCWSWGRQSCHEWFLPLVAGLSWRFVVIIRHFLRVDCWSLCILTSRPSHYIAASCMLPQSALLCSRPYHLACILYSVQQAIDLCMFLRDRERFYIGPIQCHSFNISVCNVSHRSYPIQLYLQYRTSRFYYLFI